MLLVAALYYASSRLALEFVPGWGHATAVWPASGIMLAAVLLLGPHVWPGIVAGSFAASLGSSLAAHEPAPLFAAIATSIAIALASSAQALVGAFSVKRLAGYPNTLSNESDVLRFLVLAGPVSSLIRTSIGVAALSIFGVVQREDVLLTFGIWWVGDTFGTALFAPLVLLWFDGSVRVRWRRKISVSAPLLLTIALSVVLFEAVARSQALDRSSWQAWSALAGGLLFTGLLGAFLMVVTGRADAIEELVARRTREIERANENLRHEISERARAEAQHQQSEARLAAAQHIAHLGSWELDLRMNRFLWSDELYRIHALPKRSDEWIDFATFLSQVHPDDQDSVDTVFGKAQRDLKPFGFRYRIVRPDGTVRTLDGRGEITLDPASGNAIRMHGTGQDVTEMEQAEKELADRTLELERSNAELERFAYVASHDLQEPLRAVASHVQILQEDYQGKLDAEADESIRCAVEGARRMRDLIQDYLAYSRVRIGADPLELTSSEEALARAVYGLDDRIRETRARVTHDELPEVIADPAQLVDLFKNLIANAVKFKRDELPRVHVSAARADKTWIFSVRDNGIGIDPEHTARIFQLFQRLHTQDRYPGTGIGLAICKKIVERHGGRIWVESMPDMGSVFHFTLPFEAEERGARVADQHEARALVASCGIDAGDLR
ncbi:MAG: ATP-binding protein [Planctomycetota bacterium]